MSKTLRDPLTREVLTIGQMCYRRMNVMGLDEKGLQRLTGVKSKEVEKILDDMEVEDFLPKLYKIAGALNLSSELELPATLEEARMFVTTPPLLALLQDVGLRNLSELGTLCNIQHSGLYHSINRGDRIPKKVVDFFAGLGYDPREVEARQAMYREGLANKIKRRVLTHLHLGSEVPDELKPKEVK